MAARRNRPPCPPAVSAVLARAMTVDPGGRYGCARDFAQAFRDAHARAQDGGARRPAVFISYQRSVSSPWARLVKNEMERAHGFDVFVDFEQRDTVGPFPKRLERHIQRCDVFVCLLAGSTLASSWVQREIELASRAGKPMIPVFQESFEHPGDLQTLATPVQELLTFDGVKLLDLQNLYVDAALRMLGESIKQLVGSTSGRWNERGG
jgi:hypothetical protein